MNPQRRANFLPTSPVACGSQNLRSGIRREWMPFNPQFSALQQNHSPMNMNPLQEAITRHNFFHGMRPEHSQLLVEGARSVPFKAGEILFREGEPANQFYLIQSGKVCLESLDPMRGTSVVEFIGPGDVLGWSWMFPPFSWHFQARAVEAGHAIVMNGGHLLVTAEGHPDFGYQLMKRMAQVVIHRLQATRKRLLVRDATTTSPQGNEHPPSTAPLPVAPQETLRKVITHHAFFKGLDAQFTDSLVDCASLQGFGTGQVIFREGQQADRFFLILKGRVALEAFVPRSGHTIIQTIEPGSALGWSWLYAPYEWQFSARALDPLETVVFDASRLRGMAEQNHDFGFDIMNRVGKVILESLQGTRRKLTEFYVKDLVE